MKNICLNKITLIFLLIFFAIPLFSNSILSRDGFYAYKLDNGLELYFQEDFSSTMLHINYTTRAGFSAQSSEDKDFFELYSNLFWQNKKAPLSKFNNLGCTDYSARCTIDSAIYSFSTPLLSWKEALQLFNKNLQEQSFLSTNIDKEMSSMLRDAHSYTNSATGFINSVIDSYIFSKSSWKYDRASCLKSFDGLEASDCSLRLQLISDKYYTPNNSAFFISGPIKGDIVLTYLKTLLGSWKMGVYTNNQNNQNGNLSIIDSSQKDQKQQLRRFVLVSDRFSNDMNQMVIQYTAPGLFSDLSFSTSAYTISSILNSNVSSSTAKVFRQAVVNDDLTGITDIDYANAAFSNDGEYSRIIIQTLMKNTLSPVQETEHILKLVDDSIHTISEMQLEQVKRANLAEYKKTMNSASTFIESLTANWAYGGILYNQEFRNAIQQQNVKSLVSSCTYEPWVFLVIHTDTYSKYKDKLKKAGFKLVTQKITDTHSTIPIEQEKETFNDITKEKSILQWVAINSQNVTQTTLHNGIPFYVKKIEGVSTNSIILNIKANQNLLGQGIEPVVLNALKGAMYAQFSALYRSGRITMEPSITAFSTLSHNSLQIECLAEDTPTVLSSMATVLVYGGVTPAQADECVFSQLYKMRTKAQSLKQQLTATAMKDICDNVVDVGFFQTDEQGLQSITFDQITDCYTQFLDAQRLSLVVVGNIPENLIQIAEQSFGIFKNFSMDSSTYANSKELPKLSTVHIPNMIRQVRLRHTFTTDIPAELAGPAPEELIPTSDFSDPAQLYLEAPSITSSTFVLYRAGLELLAQELNSELKTMSTPCADSVTAIFATNMDSYACLEFEGVHNRVKLQKLTEKYLAKFYDEFTQDMVVKAQLISTVQDFSKTASVNGTALLINKGLQLKNNASLYVLNYKILTFAKVEDFKLALEYFGTNYARYWLFSVDTKK